VNYFHFISVTFHNSKAAKATETEGRPAVVKVCQSVDKKTEGQPKKKNNQKAN
jgi:hypothetical protein